MKVFVCAFLVAQVVLQICNGQVIRSLGGGLIDPYGPLLQGGPVIQNAPLISPGNPVILNNNNVAASLADTLSLLTVSSLLSESLPLGPNIIGLPAGGCGCGCGGLGYPYGGAYYI